MESVLFYLLGAGTLLGALGVLVARNPLHSALSLVASFFFLAGIYLLLGAQLIAVLQVLVYAGAVMVLFVFVITLLNLNDAELGESRFTVAKAVGVVAVAATTAALLKTLIDAMRARGGLFVTGADLARAHPDTFGTVRAVGRSLLIDSVLPFELTSLLLLAAIVGAVVVAKGKI